MAGNLGGLVMALLVQVLVHQPTVAFLAVATVVLLAIPLAARTVTLRELTEQTGIPATEHEPGALGGAQADVSFTG
jgi:hypothetical protein